MRAAVVYFSQNNNKNLENLSRALAKGIGKQGFFVDVFNANDLTRRLVGYKLVAVGTEASGGFGSRIPEGLDKFLARIGPFINVRSMAFITNKGIRHNKSLQKLMKIMEAEGLFIISSEVLENESAAEAVGEKLIIK